MNEIDKSKQEGKLRKKFDMKMMRRKRVKK